MYCCVYVYVVPWFSRIYNEFAFVPAMTIIFFVFNTKQTRKDIVLDSSNTNTLLLKWLVVPGDIERHGIEAQRYNTNPNK